MGLFLIYIMKSALCLAVFYLFFRLLLTGETFHQFNRFALLGILLLSGLLPLIEIQVTRPMLDSEQMQLLLSGEVLAVSEVQQGVTMPWWVAVLLLGYVAGILFFAGRNLFSLGWMFVLLRHCRQEPLEHYLPGCRQKAVLLVHDKPIAPFSWMKYIVLNRVDLEENGREILLHELSHIRHHHSWDLLWSDVFILLQWFNPAAWLIKEELQTLHEYQADEAVLNNGVNAKQYQLLLIKKAVGNRLYSMANSFNHSKLKKRITMMMKKPSQKWARAKYLYVLPLAAVVVMAFARPEVSQASSELSSAKVNDLVSLVKENTAKTSTPSAAKDSIYNVVEQMPSFGEGGIQGAFTYVAKNMKYPESAVKAKKQGRVLVSFVIDAEGNVTNVTVPKPVDADLDAEAIRVISSMPKWTPGRQDGKPVAVKFMMPVLFKLTPEKAADASAKASKEDGLKIVGAKGTQIGDVTVVAYDKDSETQMPADVLYVIDGVRNADPKKLNPDNIESITVLKNAASLEKYDAKDKKGVIIVTTKKAKGK